MWPFKRKSESELITRFWERVKHTGAPEWTPTEIASWLAKMELGVRSIHIGLVCGARFDEAQNQMSLEISADGVAEQIPLVRRIVEAAPDIPGLTVVAFRQPVVGEIDVDGNAVSAENCYVTVKGERDNQFDVLLHISCPIQLSDKDVSGVGLILLDQTLGELFVMTRLGEIEFTQSDVAPGSETLTEFASRVLA